MKTLLALIPNWASDEYADHPELLEKDFAESVAKCLATGEFDGEFQCNDPLDVTVLDVGEYSGDVIIRIGASGRETPLRALWELVEANDLRDDCHPVVLIPRDYRHYDTSGWQALVGDWKAEINRDEEGL